MTISQEQTPTYKVDSVLRSAELFTIEQYEMLNSKDDLVRQEAAKDLGRQFASTVHGNSSNKMTWNEFSILLLEDALPSLGLSPEISDLVYIGAINSFDAIEDAPSYLRGPQEDPDKILVLETGYTGADFNRDNAIMALRGALGDSRGSSKILKSKPTN